jgi:GTP pyrophosphokinase
MKTGFKTKEEALIRKMHQRFDKIFDHLDKEVRGYALDYNPDILKKAYEFGLKAHIRQRRYSGEPYYEHCLNVAAILAELRMDMTTIISGLLHDVVEDTEIQLDDVYEEFGDTIGLLVDGVTKISELKFQSKELRQAETFRKMLLSMAKDVRVIMIKFADRLHNMRTLEHVPEKKRPRIAIETRDVYVPLAHRFGIAKIKWELEDLCLKHLETEEYNALVDKIKLSRDQREEYIRIVAEPIYKEMEKNGIKAQISGRPKSFFSIYNKMQKRNRPFEEIYDLLAIRIIVDKVEQCYYALGILHNLYNPVYDRFKDYIAMPKINGYQSLHTTVVGPDGKMVEIQIRTQAMHILAEDGIAAHWKYKHGSEEDNSMVNSLNWVKELLDRQASDDAKDFMEDLKIDLFQDEVFLFSPKGDLLKLPAKSSPIDFAYAIHTNVGNHCIGAKVNGKIVPLRTQLKSGDQVEIITSQNQKPTRDWLGFVKTSKARHWIKKFLKEEQLVQIQKTGQEILTKFFKKHKISEKSPEFIDNISKLGFNNYESLVVAIGRGEFMVEAIAKKLFPNNEEVMASPDATQGILKKIIRKKQNNTGIKVQGMSNMLINFANCCHPVPGDSITGYLTKGRGITIHKADCKNLINLLEEKQRIIETDWDTDADQEFQVHILIIGEDRKNFLKDIALCVSKQDTNIIMANFTVEDMFAQGHLKILVKNLIHLNKIINDILKLPGVVSVERVNDPAYKES